jgi:hypothetical protein
MTMNCWNRYVLPATKRNTTSNQGKEKTPTAKKKKAPAKPKRIIKVKPIED